MKKNEEKIENKKRGKFIIPTIAIIIIILIAIIVFLILKLKFLLRMLLFLEVFSCHAQL